MGKAGDTAKGAAGGAVTGATLGSVAGPYGTVIGGAAGGIIGGVSGYLNSDDGGSPEERRKKYLSHQASEAGGGADESYDAYRALGTRGNGALDYLQAQSMGQNSISSEQLRQGLQANLNAQQSMAASASPQNAAMAARTAAIQSARLGQGFSGQQALAGLQERAQAQAAYANLLQGLRGQEANVTLGSRQNAMTGYGAANAGAPQPSWVQQYGPAVQAGLSAYAQSRGSGGGGGSQPASTAPAGRDGLMDPYAASDRRLKKDVKDGDEGANKMLEGLKAFTYRYKDEGKHGAGERTGIMAQDLERAGIKHAVIDTPGGKMVHGAHLSTANTAMIAGLHKRLAKLEGAKA